MIYAHITELVINLDNGPNSASSRTQFLRRMVEFSEATGLSLRSTYYPPYHSKYNPVERCWWHSGRALEWDDLGCC